MSTPRLTHLCCLALLACGCSVVRVEPGAGPSMVASLRASLPGDDGLSARTLQELYRLDLYRLYPDDADEIANRLHAEAVTDPRPDLLFALAEVAHLRGRQLEHDNDARATVCYFRAAGYAWHYLFGECGVAGNETAAFDPRFRLACDVYNTALARCVVLALTWGQLDAQGRWALPGPDAAMTQLSVSHVGFDWKAEELGTLTPCTAHRVIGLGAAHRTYGVGVPLVGQRDAKYPRPFVADDATFPVSAVCRFEGTVADLVERPRASLELINPLAVSAIKIRERSVPLESDLTTPLACYLGQTHFEKAGYLSFLKPNIVGDRGGLHFLEPHCPGKIPVVLIHGLLSSPQTWVPVINELQSDPIIRKHFRFGMFFYPTGEPYLATAADLRRDLAAYRAAVDPQGKDAALRETVVCGHSMGGLVGRLMTVDGGEDFWRSVSEVPSSNLGHDEACERLRQMYFFAREPTVTRVVFFGTPHQGSDISASRLGWVAACAAGLPRELMKTAAEVTRLHPQHTGCKVHSSIELMAPEAEALKVLAARPRTPGVAFHSVIGMSPSKAAFMQSCFGGDGGSGDGVVSYASAYLDGAESTLTVPADHTVIHHHPLAVRELRKILHQHLDEIRRRTGSQARP